MKSFIAIFVLIGVAVAQTPAPTTSSASLSESLIKRGTQIKDIAQRAIAAVRDQPRLTRALEHEVILIEALILDLQKTPIQNEQHRHTIEEDLLHLENRVAEEVDAITRALEHTPTPGRTAEQLITQAEALLVRANAAMKVPNSDRDLATAKNEVKLINDLIREIRLNPQNVAQHERELVRHEQTLERVIARMTRNAAPTTPVVTPGATTKAPVPPTF